MKIIVFDKNTSKNNFNTYGYGKLKKVISCKVIEELNGRYEVELEVSQLDSKAKYLKKWAVLYVDGQLFRINSIVKSDLNYTIKVVAVHIFYDIDFGFVEDRRAEDKTMDETLEIALPQDMWGVFTHSSDITEKNSIYFVKNNGVNAIFRAIERWGKGELVRDNFHYEVNNAKGKDKGVTFTYKKIEEIEVTEVLDEVITRIYPVGNDGITLDEKYITIPNWSKDDYLPYHITKEVKYDADNQGDLRALATKDAESIGISKVNFKISVNDLLGTDLYAEVPQLMTLDVGDILTIKHSILGIREKIKVIKKEHELVSNDISLELGQPLDTFFKSVDNSSVTSLVGSIGTYKNGLFYHSNGTSISIMDKKKQVANVNFSVSDTSNLMLFINVFYKCYAPGECKINIYQDNEILPFQPVVDIKTGQNVLSFTYPLIGVGAGTSHLIVVELDVKGRLQIQPQHVHVMVQGQGLVGGGGEKPHAEAIETFKLKPLDNISKLSGRESFNIKIQQPKKISAIEKTGRLDEGILTFKIDNKYGTIDLVTNKKE